MRISLQEASKLLSRGEVVAVPTETVYGLAASLRNPAAIDKIFSLKGRPSNNPLIIHVSHKQQIEEFASFFPPGFNALAETFWPGPLSIVLTVDPEKVPSRARAGLPTAAFRIPNHRDAMDLMDMSGPLVMPSANLSGKPSATKPEHVETDFGRDFPVLDGGPCQRGLESTIVIYREERWEIIRLGSLSAEDFFDVLGYCPRVNIHGAVPLCPGQLYRHYAPQCTLILRMPPDGSKVIIGFDERKYPEAFRVISLGSLDSPENIAENLYDILRRLDSENIPIAHVDMDFPKTGLWATIFERLNKAANI